MRIIALGALAIAVTSLLASGTAATDPPPGTDEPAATKGYTGFDATTLCSSATLSAADKTECRLDMNAAQDETSRAAIQKRYEAKLGLPRPHAAKEASPRHQGAEPFLNPSP